MPFTIWIKIRVVRRYRSKRSNSKRGKFTRSRSVSRFSETTPGPFCRDKVPACVKMPGQRLSKNCSGKHRTHALANRNCEQFPQESTPIHSREPSDRKRFESHLGYRSWPLGRDRQSASSKSVSELAGAGVGGVFTEFPSHTWSYNAPPSRRGVSGRVEWKGWNAPGRERT